MATKLKTFRISLDLDQVIAEADDPIPLQRFLIDCIAYRYGLTDKVPTRVEEDRRSLLAQQVEQGVPAEEDLITIKEAAKKTGYSAAHIRTYLIPEGKLASFKMADNTLRVYRDLRPTKSEDSCDRSNPQST